MRTLGPVAPVALSLALLAGACTSDPDDEAWRPGG
jgi:hypothetical protein